jgi:histone demethylase JARID1
MSSLSTSLKNSYQRYLQPYEEWVKSAKQQIEAEYGGPITPSPGASPIKRTPIDKLLNSPIGSSFGPDSPAIKASSALAASVGTPDKSDIDMMDTIPIKSNTPSTLGAFNAVNSGNGFTPVNTGLPGFTPVNSTNGTRREAETGLTPGSSSKRSENGAGSRRESPEGKSAAGSPLKRQHSQENGSDAGSLADGKAEDSEGGERRSKRLKKGTLAQFCNLNFDNLLADENLHE